MNNGNGNIIRKHTKDKNFTIIDNNIFMDKNLSLKGKGLLTMLLSLPNNWAFSERGLTALSKDGRDSLRSGLDELEELGYLERRIGRNDNGQFANTVYNIYEKPKSEKPKSEKPTSEKPTSDNPTVYKELNNKELSNKELNNIKDIVEVETIPYQEIIDYLNLRLGTNYKHTASKNKSLIKARFNEGYTLQDFKDVIDKKCLDWVGTDLEKYLRPETLFSNKFDSYLNQKVQPKKNSNPYLDMQFDSEGNLI